MSFIFGLGLGALFTISVALIVASVDKKNIDDDDENYYN